MGCGSPADDERIERSNKKRVTQSKNKDIRKNYEFISMLGNGTFGKVRLYRDRNYKDLLFAIKTLKKEGIPPYQFQLLKSEVNILSNMDHPNIVKYFGTFEDQYHIHIVMEYLKGQDLLKIISLKNYTHFEEKYMCQIIHQLLKALAFIHSKNIIHRDIKPENILFSDKRNYSTLKLIDFGLATFSKHDHKSVGTPFYMSPEMIDGNSDPLSDMWSVGVIVYQMITGKLPFEVKNKENENLYDKIKNENYNTENLEDIEYSDEVKDFISKALQKDVNTRMTIQQAMNHPWIQKFCIKSIDKSLLTNESIRMFLEFSKKTILQKEILYFFAKVSNEKEIAHFKKIFNQFDSNNIGSLSFEDFQNGFKKIGIDVDDIILQTIFEGLNFHQSGRISYSEFLSAMVSSKNFSKDDKITSVFNLLKENEQNRNYITYESLYNAGKALNLNINEEEIKKCFKEYGSGINFENFEKLVNKDKTDTKSVTIIMKDYSSKNRKLLRSLTEKKDTKEFDI